jgi:hypothetical protein
MTFSSVRSARLTDLASPKAAATSGSSTTIWLPGFRRAAYLFRTPLLKSYSGRIVSRSRLPARLGLGFFFIGIPLAAAGKAGTDDSNQIPAFDVRDHHQAAAVRLSEKNEPLLTDRVVGIRNCDRVRIREGRSGFRKPDSVLPKVGRSLLRIPGELETHFEIYGSQELRASA